MCTLLGRCVRISLMADDRIKELLRQRALIEEHLCWLESEINGAQSEIIETPQAASSHKEAIPANRLISDLAPELEASDSSLLAPGAHEEPDNAQVVSDLYEELGPETQNSVNDARRGCMMIFAFAFLTLAAIAAWVWWQY